MRSDENVGGLVELLLCPFCRCKAGTYVSQSNGFFVVCDTCGAQSGGYSTKVEAIAAWNTRVSAHGQPVVDEAMVERLRKRAEYERQIASNSQRVADLLAPELALFDQRSGHNTYAVRLAIEHRDSAKKDAQFADDLEAAIAALKGADHE